MVSLYVPGFLLSLGLGLVAPFAAIYATSFGVDFALASLVVSAAAIGRVVMDLPAGMITDRFGRRRPVLLAPLIVAVASVLAGLTDSFWLLVAYRVLEGAGLALWNVARRTVIIDQVPRLMRGRVVSSYLSVSSAGLAAGPVFGGVIAAAFGIRAVFFAYALAAAVSFVGVLLFVKESRLGGRASSPFHGLRQLAKGFPELGPMRVTFLLITTGFVINTLRTASNNTIFPLLGTFELSLSTVQIGLALGLFAFVVVVARFPGGYITDRFGRKRGIVPAQVIGGVGTLAMFFVSDFTSVLVVLAATAVGQGLSSGTITTVVGDIAPSSSRGSFIAVQALLIDLAQGLGPLALGALADLAGLRVPFLVAGAAMLVSAFTIQAFAHETISYNPE